MRTILIIFIVGITEAIVYFAAYDSPRSLRIILFNTLMGLGNLSHWLFTFEHYKSSVYMENHLKYEGKRLEIQKVQDTTH